MYGGLILTISLGWLHCVQKIEGETGEFRKFSEFEDMADKVMDIDKVKDKEQKVLMYWHSVQLQQPVV